MSAGRTHVGGCVNASCNARAPPCAWALAAAAAASPPPAAARRRRRPPSAGRCRRQAPTFSACYCGLGGPAGAQRRPEEPESRRHWLTETVRGEPLRPGRLGEVTAMLAHGRGEILRNRRKRGSARACRGPEQPAARVVPVKGRTEMCESSCDAREGPMRGAERMPPAGGGGGGEPCSWYEVACTLAACACLQVKSVELHPCMIVLQMLTK